MFFFTTCNPFQLFNISLSHLIDLDRQRALFTRDKENDTPTLDNHNNLEHDTNESHVVEDNVELNDCESGGLVPGGNECMLFPTLFSLHPLFSVYVNNLSIVILWF